MFKDSLWIKIHKFSQTKPQSNLFEPPCRVAIGMRWALFAPFLHLQFLYIYVSVFVLIPVLADFRGRGSIKAFIDQMAAPGAPQLNFQGNICARCHQFGGTMLLPRKRGLPWCGEKVEALSAALFHCFWFAGRAQNQGAFMHRSYSSFVT